MIEVILVGTTIAGFNYIERHQLGDNQLKQPTTVKIYEAFAWRLGQHYLVKFVVNTLSTDDFYTLGITLQGFKRLVFYKEIQLCCKANTTHHAQRIIGKCYIWVERCTDNTVFHVVNAIERINKLAETLLVQAYCQSIDGEVTAVLIVFKCTVFNMRFARIVAVTFLSCPHEFNLHATIFHLCCAEITEH